MICGKMSTNKNNSASNQPQKTKLIFKIEYLFIYLMLDAILLSLEER
jgi:hypothetical protein